MQECLQPGILSLNHLNFASKNEFAISTPSWLWADDVIQECFQDPEYTADYYDLCDLSKSCINCRSGLPEQIADNVTKFQGDTLSS